MSEKPPEQRPDDDAQRNDEGSADFMLGPRDLPDGTPVEITPEVRRRLEAVVYRAVQLAKQHGLDVQDILEPNPSKVSESARSTEIKQAANPKMADVAATVRMNRDTFSIKQGDTEIKATKTEIEISVMADVAKAIEALAAAISKPFRWSGRIAIRFGKWVLAKVSASSDEETSRK